MSDINKQHGFGREYMLGEKHIDNIFLTRSKYLYNVIN